MNGKMRTYLVVIIAIGALFLAQSGLFAAMIITSKDGRQFQVDIDSNEISSIEFTGETIALPGESLIFEDAFDEKSLSNWNGSAAGRKVLKGVAEFYSANHSTFKLKKGIPVEDVIIEWRGAAHQNGFHGNFGPYGFNLGGWNNSASGCSGPNAPFQRINTGKVYEPGRMQIWKLERIGDNYAAYVDGKRILSRKITGGQNKGQLGHLQFSSYNSRLQIDWIRIRRP